jgi:hypothetical protein
VGSRYFVGIVLCNPYMSLTVRYYNFLYLVISVIITPPRLESCQGPRQLEVECCPVIFQAVCGPSSSATGQVLLVEIASCCAAGRLQPGTGGGAIPISEELQMLHCRPRRSRLKFTAPGAAKTARAGFKFLFGPLSVGDCVTFGFSVLRCLNSGSQRLL